MNAVEVEIDDSIAGVSVRAWDGAGYKPVVKFGRWRFAELNHAEKFRPENLAYRERHLKTDETFVLVEGEATLLIGESLRRVPMVKFRFYNVKAGTWHQIQTAPGTRVLIVENDDVDAASEIAAAGAD